MKTGCRQQAEVVTPKLATPVSGMFTSSIQMNINLAVDMNFLETPLPQLITNLNNRSILAPVRALRSGASSSCDPAICINSSVILRAPAIHQQHDVTSL